MPDRNIHILSTRPIGQPALEAAREKGIVVDEISFIETIPFLTAEVTGKIRNVLHLPATVVFTSMNAVEAVATCINGVKPTWKIYCIGNATQSLVKRYFDRSVIAGTADNAIELASVIVGNNPSGEVTFFCGDQRRDELPDKLLKNDIALNEIEVYKTVSLPNQVDADYEGILFFSPSAVDSFFSVNNINEHTVLFAIGTSTADTIKKYTDNAIVVAATPGKENLVQLMMEHFSE